RLAAERPRTAVMTRVHRYELYEDAFRPPFQPWHPELYGAIARTAAISRHGFDYLRAAGVPGERLWLARLGTEAARQPASASDDGIVRLVSCSAVTAVKRVPAIAEALAALARAHPHERFHWTHFGGGPELRALRAGVATNAPANLVVDLRGHVDNGAVLAHYVEQPVDLFVSMSASEGLPVAIQEAIGAGVPVLATDVGGVGEAVGSDNGALLPAGVTTADVVAALERCLIHVDKSACGAMRSASLRRWREDFDAQRNHTRFAAQVRELGASL
ncbi:MAG: glycosyltransferase, partial [Caldimonas sp.]